MVENDSFAFPLTQQDLGDLLGVSTVHINRAFQGLKRDGLINFKGRRLMILDFDALREIAEFNPDYLHLCF